MLIRKLMKKIKNKESQVEKRNHQKFEEQICPPKGCEKSECCIGWAGEKQKNGSPK
jgi:hypothetical protein